MRPLVELHGVTCGYGGRPALVDVELIVHEGQFTGVVGPSGSGKTTLLRVMVGSLRPEGGRVVRPSGVRVGYVPQVETVDWSFPVTVDECVRMADVGGRWPWPSRQERRAAAAVLERLGLAGLAGRHIRELSGGQQQRMFVARALLGQPQLLLLDEPTSGVDVATRHDLLHLLADLHHDGLAIVLTTHDLNGIAAHLPHLVCLHRSVLAEGTPSQVLTPTVLEATFGAPMDVLVHAGLPVVVDGGQVHHRLHLAPAALPGAVGRRR